MKLRFLVFLVLVWGSLASCTIPFVQQGAARVEFQVNLPDSAPAASQSGRLVLSDTASLLVTLSTPGEADVVQAFSPTIDTSSGVRIVHVALQTSPGAHTLAVQGVDGDGVVLTAGSAEVLLVAGLNTISLKLSPPSVLVPGDGKSLALGATAYYTVSADSPAILTAVGSGSIFWEAGSDGAFSGPGAKGRLTVDTRGGAAKYLKVVQAGAAGSFTINTAVGLAPSSKYGLSVGVSTTTGSTKTSMAITWNNPNADTVYLYRATSLAGSYNEVYTGTGNQFSDSEATGLVPGSTYYYTIALQQGALSGLTASTLSSSMGTFSHVDPVPGVVSGTTMGWDTVLNASVPVLGTSYLVPDSTIPPQPTAIPMDSWDTPEFPTLALLAGGYTYWAWGKSVQNDSNIMIAGFDSQGAYVNSATLKGARYISALTLSGSTLTITNQSGSSSIDWSALAPF